MLAPNHTNFPFGLLWLVCWASPAPRSFSRRHREPPQEHTRRLPGAQESLVPLKHYHYYYYYYYHYCYYYYDDDDYYYQYHDHFYDYY